jgi:pyruvate formate lyase activating enzyme
MNGKIHSIESFGTVDGPGIRLVVFMQGCPMRCLYCHNPDTWSVNGGREVSAQEIIDEYEKYKEFLTNGGITITGGEPLMQIDFVTEVFMLAKQKNIHTCLDTSGVTFRSDSTEKFDRLMEYTDLILLDIKHIDSLKHKEITSHSNENILAFARYLKEKDIPVWIRHVVVEGYTDNEEDLLELGKFLSSMKNMKALDVLPYHDMGRVKYEKLGLEYPLKDIQPLSKSEAVKARDIIIRGIKQGLREKTE